jgi:uncharacterized protein
MTGMNKATGKPIEGEAHIVQSIADILTTPLGSCVMRRDYGSRLFELIDKPLTPGSHLLWIAATAGAIRKWEPRVSLEKVSLTLSAAGKTMLTLIARRTDLPTNPLLTLTIPI